MARKFRITSLKNFFVLFLFLITFAGVGQETTTHFVLRGEEEIINTVFLPDKGIVMVTGNLNTFGPKCTLRYINAAGKELWNKVIDVVYQTQNSEISVVVTPDTQTIYFVVINRMGIYGKNESGFYSKKHYIHQFTIDGQEKKFELDGRKEFGKALLTIFCDDDYLYYLATENGNESKTRKKSEEKMILNRFKKTDLTYKKFILDLPPVEGDDNTIFWSLIGQKGDEKWLASKTIDITEQRFRFTMVPVDSQGKVGQKVVVETALPEGEKLRALDNVYNGPWESRENNLDFSISGSGPWPNDGAFGQIAYNDQQDCFFVYGIFGSKKYNRDFPHLSNFEGFYVHKFDRSGNSVWKVQEKADMPLTFRFRFMPATDGVIANAEMSEVRSGDMDSWLAVGVTADGKATTLNRSGEYFNLKTFYSARRKLKTLAYIEKQDAPKRIQYTCFQNTSNELLIRFDRRTGDLDVLNFGN